MGVRTERSRSPDGCFLTDECSDGIPRRPDGCKGSDFTVLNFAQSLLEVHNRSIDSEYNSIAD
jgi:hypothetical protein